jgi:membrane-associated phospholipid phosphatase
MNQIEELSTKVVRRIVNMSLLEMVSFIISTLFSPLFVACVFFLIVAAVDIRDIQTFWHQLVIIIFFIAILPVVYILLLLEQGKISSLQLDSHADRKKPFMFAAISSLIGLIIIYLLGAPKAFLAMDLAFTLNVLIIAIVTQWWKISIHSAVIAAIVILSIILFGKAYWVLSIIWILVAWARVYRKRHTIAQVLAGALVAIATTGLVFYLFGY